MAKFDFQGKLYEKGRRVITGVVRDININTLDPSASASGTLEVETNDQTGSSLKMNLSLPKGEPGEKGDLPTIKIGRIVTFAAGKSAKVIAEESSDGKGYELSFGIPRGQQGNQGPRGYQGEQGLPGRTPKVAVVKEIDVLEPGQQAFVDDEDSNIYDAL